MREATNFEKIAHGQMLKKFEDRKFKINRKFMNDDITRKVRDTAMRELKEEETAYYTTSGMIFYFGKLFVRNA